MSIENLEQRLERILFCISAAACGELDHAIEATHDDELAPIEHGVNLLIGDIRELLEQERAQSQQLAQKHQEVIRLQQDALLEMSAPVSQVWDDVLVMPLVGAIDTSRAQQITESLLDAITRKQAAVVIIDIAGVPEADTQVANHLLRTAAAAGMLGAEVIITGVSPANAQTLVRLGVDLSAIRTLGSLQQGLRLAFDLLGRAVVPKERVS